MSHQMPVPVAVPESIGDASLSTAFPLTDVAEHVIRGGHEPIFLNDDSLWFVIDGHVDLFSVPLIDGKPAGSRTHLVRVSAGAPFLGFGGNLSADRGVVGIATAGAKLLQTSREALQLYVSEHGITPAVRALIDAWILTVCRALVDRVVPQRATELATETEQTFADATPVRLTHGVSWLTHLDGHSALYGRPALIVNGAGFTPLSQVTWLLSDAGSRVLSLPTSAISDASTLWTGLANLHALALQHDAERSTERQGAYRDRLTRREAVNTSALARACTTLAAAIDPSSPVHAARRANIKSEFDPTTYEEAVLSGARLVGDALALTILPRPRSENQTAPRDPLAAILRASRLRSRMVALRGRWWLTDAGPMLAYAESDRTPIALIPDPRGRYVAHDTVRGGHAVLTPELAQTLIPFAHTFYRHFPDRSLELRDVIQFGSFRCGKDLAVLITMGLAAAVLGMVPAIATGVLFNTAIPGAMRSQVVQVLVVLIVCAVTMAAFNIVRGIALLRIEGRMGSAVQAAVWDRLLALPLPFFRQFTAGELASRAMSIDSIRQVISGATVNAIMGGIFSVGNICLMFWYSPAMAWRGLLLIAIAVVITIAGSWQTLKPSRAVLTLQARTSGLVLQLLTSVAKLRVAAAESRAFQLWASRFSEQRALQFRVRMISNWIQAFNAAYPTLALIWIFSTALPMIATRNSGLGTGDFLAFLSAFSTSLSAMLGTCFALLGAFNTIPMYEAARPILATRPEVDTSKSDPGTLTGQIDIQHALFRYTDTGPTVLRDVSIAIQPGEFVAFVGPSGSGKSTLLRLLLGFERLESGAIYFDGQDLAGLDVQALRRQLGVVLQNGRLMSGDIFTNISGSSTIGMDDAWDAARMAGIEEDIRAMPMGMHTVISEGGGTLSGGQRQRLLIARAIVHRPRILLFDEATSALDNRTQAIVSRSLETLQATRIVVAHRLSTIVNADRIVVIERGHVVQQGRYHDLLAEPGLFRDLALRQIA
jgi:NHLM bacteriocin system ABC transporter ATP-binding protein